MILLAAHALAAHALAADPPASEEGPVTAPGVVFHVGVSTGKHVIPALADVLGPGTFARVDVGAGPAPVQGYLVAQLALHDGMPWYDQAAYGGPVAVVGDVLFAQVGLGARMPFDVWVLRLVPHVDLGVSNGSSPIDPVAYEEDVLPEFGGTRPTVGLSATGAWAQLGGDIGVPVIRDAVDLYLAADVGYIAIRGVGLTLDARVGLAARF